MLGESRGERRFTRSVCLALAVVDRVHGGREGLPLTGWRDGRTVLGRLRLDPASLDRAWQGALAGHEQLHR
jgi:hypothetical protein